MLSGGKLNHVYYTGKTKARGRRNLSMRGHDQGEKKGNEGRPLLAMSEVCLALLCGSEKTRLHLLGC